MMSWLRPPMSHHADLLFLLPRKVIPESLGPTGGEFYL